MNNFCFLGTIQKKKSLVEIVFSLISVRLFHTPRFFDYVTDITTFSEFFPCIPVVDFIEKQSIFL